MTGWREGRGLDASNVREPDVVCPLGPAWAANSVNCTSYRQHGLVSHGNRQYGAYYDGEGALCAFRRERGALKAEFAQHRAVVPPDDAHFSPSVGLDDGGWLHVMGGAHVSRPFHLQARAAGDAFSLEPADAGQGDDSLAEASYPSFLSSGSGALFLLYRVGRPARSAWRACRWRADLRSWEDRSFPLLSGITSDAWPAGPYINTPLRERGGRFGFFVVWRSESLAGSRRRVFNSGIDYLEADLAEAALFAHSGARLPTPVTPAVTERVVAVPWLGDLSNQAGATRLPDGRPFGLGSWRAGRGGRQIHAFWPTRDGVWRSRRLTAFGQDSRLDGRGTLYLPHSRPVCAARPDGSVTVIYRSEESGGGLVCHVLRPPAFGVMAEESYILWPGDLGYYEPVLDVGLAEKTGILSLFLQRCGGAPDGATGTPASPADAVVAEWRLP